MVFQAVRITRAVHAMYAMHATRSLLRPLLLLHQEPREIVAQDVLFLRPAAGADPEIRPHGHHGAPSVVDPIPIARVLVRRTVVVNDRRVLSQVAQIVVGSPAEQRFLFVRQAFEHQDDVEHSGAAEAGEEAARSESVGREVGDAVAHGAPEVGAEDEDVEARSTRHLVVEVACGGLGEANAGVGCAFAVVDGDGPLLLADIESGPRAECGDGVWHVEAEEELCIVAEVGGAPSQVALARAVQGGQVVHVRLEIVARAAQLGQREVGDAADESEVGARSADDPVGEEAALEVVRGEEGGRDGEAAGAESELPAQIGGIVDGGVEAEGAEDAVHVPLERRFSR